MASVSFDQLRIGKKYTLKELAHIWNYESYYAIRKGVVTPKDQNYIILFITKEKQKGAIPYQDDLHENILYMTGQRGHGSDKRLVSNLHNSKDEIHLFYREKHHKPFTYYGRCFLLNAELEEQVASKFQFFVKDLYDSFEDDASITDYVANIPEDIEVSDKLLIEGLKKISSHIRYERNPHNRREAIRLQGHKCKICGFDFNEIYGKDLANDYIEVHHIKPLSLGEQVINPEKDLLPVCANCHRMLHRKNKNNISVEELQMKERLKEYQRMFNELERRMINT